MKFIVLFASVAFWLGSAEADDASRCVKVDYVNGGYQNICTQTIALSLCVQNSSSLFSCSGSADRFSADILPKGVAHGVLYYERDGRGDIAVVACDYPLMVSGWKGPGTSYKCIDPNSVKRAQGSSG